MAKICLVVPHEKQPIPELRHFLAAEEADIYVFPELFLNTEVLPEALDIIRELDRFVITGYRENIDGKTMEKALVVDGGKVVGEYAKCVTTPNEKKEGRTPGDRIYCIDTRFGRIGIPICYEIHFPEVSRAMCLEHPCILFNIVGTGMFHELQFNQWNALARARAIENEIWVVGCTHNNDAIPMAFAYANDGTPMLCARGQRGAFVVEVDLEKSNYKAINYEADRRPEIFGALCQ